jgi:hypothetical protein
MNGTETSPPSSSLRQPLWKLRWGLLGLAALITLVALFYTEENVRGKRAWEKCKRDLEAQGVVLNWDEYIPPPVPDDQNFFKAPRMSEWFVGRGQTELSKRLTPPLAMRGDTNVPPLVLAEVTVVSPGQTPSSGEGDTVLDWKDSAASEQALKRLREAIGPAALGRGNYPATLIARPLNQIKPVRFLVRSDKPPTIQEMALLFPANEISPAYGNVAAETSRLRVEPDGNKSFRVVLSPAPLVAADFLAWSDQFEPEFKLIREALKRPYARIDCDYQMPETIGIPNFVMVRQLVQLLSSRAECDYLLGQPEKALGELTFLHDSCRIMEARPTGKPMTLVASMIDVAVTGLYAETIADGLRLHAWHEPQLVALQEQLKEIHLLPVVMMSFKSEPASVCRTLEMTPRARLAKLFFDIEKNDHPMQARLIRFMPRGWIYQNMAVVISQRQKLYPAFDLEHDLILPQPLNALSQETAAQSRHFSPYTFVANFTAPNMQRASQVLAHNQTMANQALIACALERYHLAHGDYPESLETLSPQFIEKIPHDLIGGQPLKYHRLAADKFLLHSVGWNETDDGGVAPPGEPSLSNYDQGDWVWR